MRASPFALHRRLIAFLLIILAATLPGRLAAQENHIPATLVADGPAVPGERLTLAIAFEPDQGWHGYWSNPGDAGLGMELDWRLPEGWQAGEPQYPVPQRLVIADLMNHVYEGPHAVLVDVDVPANAARGVRMIGLTANYLACTDKICVPQTARLTTRVEIGEAGRSDARFARWRAEIPPLLDRAGRFEIADGMLRLAIPVPQTLDLADPHIFVGTSDLADYNAVQSFVRRGDELRVAIPLGRFVEETQTVSGIAAYGEGLGVRFEAVPGEVPEFAIKPGLQDLPPLWLLLLGALGGGLLLNILPCVFPILSLKALSLVRAGESERQARSEGLAYTAGVIVACLALGGLLLALRAAGEQVGWAFQLQQPGVIAALLALTAAITANLAGLFALPSLSISRGGKPAGAFATGLLAAVIATPCTGPFMAAALGAALLLPAQYALLLFAALGLGLALPFLALGFVPALRRMLPRPGPWMEGFRKAMAIPMGLTALALLWLSWRIGGAGFAGLALVLAVFVVLGLIVAQRGAFRWWQTLALLAFAIVPFFFLALPLAEDREANVSASILQPEPYSPAALDRARSTGRPVFLWFTADWCVSCKVNESVAIEREAVREAFEDAGVIAMSGDWTRPDPDISAFLTSRGVAGVPLYVWYDAGAQDTGRTLPQILEPDLLITLAEESRRPAPLPLEDRGGNR